MRDSYCHGARTGWPIGDEGGEGLTNLLTNDDLALKADDIHNLGLSEVARIKSGMEAIKKEVGFKGTLSEFFEHLRTDPKLKPTSRAALTQGYYDIGKKVDATISTQFKYLPKAPLEIKPYEEFREKYELRQLSTPPTVRAGTFYFNAYVCQPDYAGDHFVCRRRAGHHFQISTRRKMTAARVHALGNTAIRRLD